MWQWLWTQATPTMSDPTTIPIGLLRRLLRTDQPESTKRALALLGGLTLCSCLTLMSLAVWYQALMFQKVDGNLVAALLGLSTSVAGLAGVAYYKKEPEPTTTLTTAALPPKE